jgi:TRAP-type C4-dicarboxylate transport system permease small subunit
MNSYVKHTGAFFSVVDKVLGVLLAILMTTMVVVVTWQVITRFITTQPSSFTEELARFLLIWIGILGSAYAFRKGAHLGLDLLTRKLVGKAKRSTAIVANLACLTFAASIMVFGGVELMMLTLDLNQTSPSLGVKMGYIYSVLPLSGLFICIFAIDNILQPDGDDTAAANVEPLNTDS